MKVLNKTEFIKKIKNDNLFNLKFGRKTLSTGSVLLPPCHYSFQFKSYKMKAIDRYNYWEKYVHENGLEINGMSSEQAMKHYNFPERELHLIWNQRSVDVGLGLPYNIASYGILLTLISQVTNHLPVNLIFFGGDTHIYENQFKPLKLQMERGSTEIPNIEINKQIKNINNFRYKDIQFYNYNPHGSIKMEVAV